MTSTKLTGTGTLTDDRARELRAEFPILNQQIGDHPLTYLDFGATAQRSRAVLDAERAFLEHDNAAVHRGAHELAARSTDAYESARETVATFLGADVDEIAWQAGATDALNTIALGMQLASRGGAGSEALALGPGDEILITEAEHHANLVPWQQLALATGATVRWIPARLDGTWTVDDAAAALNSRTKVFAFAHVSNVTGLIADVPALVELARSVGSVTVLDACQSAPHLPVNFKELGVDFAACSSHKMGGPNGVGVLYGRAERFAQLPAARTGGAMIEVVTMESTTFLEPPTRFEAGTQPVSQTVGLAAACNFLDAVGREAIAEHSAALGERLVTELGAIEGVRVLGAGPGVPRAGLAAFVVDGVHAHDVAQFLDSEGLAVRAGHHCAQPLHRHFGVAASTRASTFLTTTNDEIDRLVDAMGRVRAWFGVTR